MAKKNANGSGSIRQRPDGRWEARYCVGVDPTTGKTIRRSIYGSSQAEVRKKLTEVLESLDKGAYVEPNRITVKGWLEEWLTVYVENTVKPLTLLSYQTIVNCHLIPLLGNVPLQKLKGIDIQRAYNEELKSGTSAKTIHNINGVLRRSLDDALRQGYIVANPCLTVSLPKKTKAEIHPLEHDEIPLFLEEIKSDVYGNAFALCLFAGLREGECLGLSWKQVDFENETLTINQQLQKVKVGDGKRQFVISETTKSDKIRVIRPPQIAFDFLREERQKQIENRLKAGTAWDNPNDLVFTNPLGGHIVTYTFFKHFKKVVNVIGRPDLRPHDLRHSCATVALATGSDIKSVQHLLGHSSCSFTLDTYAHASQKMQEDTATKMQAYFASAKTG